MSGLVATAATQNPAEPVANDGFWPDLDPAAARESLRIDGTVTDARMRDALVAAALSVNTELQAWQDAQKALGYATVGDIPAAAIDGVNRYAALYLRAVHSTAHADLVERYRNFDATDAGLRKLEDLNATVDEQRRNARWAIRDILGVARTTVELI